MSKKKSDTTTGYSLYMQEWENMSDVEKEKYNSRASTVEKASKTSVQKKASVKKPLKNSLQNISIAMVHPRSGDSIDLVIKTDINKDGRSRYDKKAFDRATQIAKDWAKKNGWEILSGASIQYTDDELGIMDTFDDQMYNNYSQYKKYSDALDKRLHARNIKQGRKKNDMYKMMAADMSNRDGTKTVRVPLLVKLGRNQMLGRKHKYRNDIEQVQSQFEKWAREHGYGYGSILDVDYAEINEKVHDYDTGIDYDTFNDFLRATSHKNSMR
jgi:hypothetical protein